MLRHKFDVTIFVAGLPNGSAQEATTTCDVRMIPLDGEVAQSIQAKHAEFSKAVIPGGMYNGTPDDVGTFGVGATFVASTKTSADVVYAITKAVFDNFDRFKKMHPAFENLDPAAMIKNNLSAPLHEGAARYYKEQGWM